MVSPSREVVSASISMPTNQKGLRSPLKESDPNHRPRMVKPNSNAVVATQVLSSKKRSLNLLEETEKGRHKRTKPLAHPYAGTTSGSTSVTGGASSRGIEGAVLISRQQAQRRAEQSKITAKDLLDWQQNWRRIMQKDTRIYFDTAVGEHHLGSKLESRKELLKYGFSFLGAQMKMFFDMEVTIVITSRKLNRYDNLPETDVLYRAHKNGYMKIWNYDKALRFLRNLDVDLEALEKQLCSGQASPGGMLLLGTENYGGPIVPTVRGSVQTVSNTLSNLLENEKLYGPSDRDPKAKRDDFHYFRYPHVYLYDLWQMWAPLITVEWKPSELSDLEKLPYPSIKPGTFGRCPFVGDGSCDELSTRRILKRYKRDCLNEKYALKLKLIYQYSAEPRRQHEIEENEEPLVLPYSIEYMNSRKKYMEMMREDLRCKKAPPISLLTRQETTGEEGLANDDLCKRKSRIPQEIKASGVNQSLDTNIGGSVSIGNGLAPFKASNINKGLKSLNRLVVDRKFTQQTIPPPPQLTKNHASATTGTVATIEKKSASPRESASLASITPAPTPIATPAPANACATAGTGGPAAALSHGAATTNATAATIGSHTPVKRLLQGKIGGGYCENCRVKYDHLDQHIRTEKHQSFAETPMNFERIDSLISTLREENSLYGSSQ